MWQFFGIFFFVCSVQVHCYPSGAPRQSCSTLTPNHGDHQPQTSPIPYMIDISEFRDVINDCYYYTPGNTYNIRLVATGTPNIKGFIIQGRLSEDGGTTIVGEFIVPDTGRYHSCTPDKGGVTHNHTGHDDHEDIDDHDHEDIDDHNHSKRATDDEYRSLNFEWTAPPQQTGSFAFRFTVAASFDTFWTNAETAIISEGACMAGGSGQVGASILLSTCFVMLVSILT